MEKYKITETLVSTVLGINIVKGSLVIKGHSIKYKVDLVSQKITENIDLYYFLNQCEEYIFENFGFKLFIDRFKHIPYDTKSNNENDKAETRYMLDILYSDWNLENFRCVSGVDNIHFSKVDAIVHATQFILENPEIVNE